MSNRAPTRLSRSCSRRSGRSGLPALALLALLALAGCENKYYCEGKNPLDNCLAEAAAVCVSAADCTATPSTPACDVDATRTCVQCTQADPAACKDTSPVCAANACRACAADAECASGTCLPNGACGNDQTVAYVNAPPLGTDNPTCTKAAPCTKMDQALQTKRPFVRLTGTISEAVTVDNTTEVTFVGAPGARLTRPSGVGIELKGSAKLAIYDLEIAGPSGVGISMPAGNNASLTLVRARVTDNDGGGVIAVGGSLQISQSSFLQNLGGGLSINSAKFEVVNNFFVRNGQAGTVGGVRFNEITATGNRFEFNTVTRNTGLDNVMTGVACTTVLVPVLLANNIVYGNTVNGTGRQVTSDANCAWTYSNIGPDPVGGASNLNMAPAFADPNNNDFHLLPDSAGKDLADKTSKVLVDFDGDPRPIGAGPDMGADEIE